MASPDHSGHSRNTRQLGVGLLFCLHRPLLQRSANLTPKLYGGWGTEAFLQGAWWRGITSETSRKPPSQTCPSPHSSHFPKGGESLPQFHAAPLPEQSSFLKNESFMKISWTFSCSQKAFPLPTERDPYVRSKDDGWMAKLYFQNLVTLEREARGEWGGEDHGGAPKST